MSLQLQPIHYSQKHQFAAFVPVDTTPFNHEKLSAATVLFVMEVNSSPTTIAWDSVWGSNAGLFAFIPKLDQRKWTSHWHIISEQLYGYWARNGKGTQLTWWEVENDSTKSTPILPPAPTALLFSNGGSISRSYGFNFRQFSLEMPSSGLSIGLNAAHDGLDITGGNFSFNTNRFEEQQSNFISIGEQLSIKMNSEVQGSIGFQHSADENDLALLNSGFHYYYHQEEHQTNLFHSYRYPLWSFEHTGTTVDLDVYLNPIAPEDATRSLFAFGDDVLLASNFSSTLGHALYLRTEATAEQPCGFALVNHPTGTQTTGHYCLSPLGRYLIDEFENAPNEQHQLLCGLAGTESIGVESMSTGTDKNYLSLVPGKPAYAPVFPLATTKPKLNATLNKGEDTGTLLTDHYGCTTSYVEVTAEGSPSHYYSGNYFGQPESSALFSPNADPAASKTLKIFPAVASNTFRFSTKPTRFPMVPYAGVELSPSDNMSLFEFQILNPVRKQTIVTPDSMSKADQEYTKAVSGHTATPCLTSTPQGYLVNVNEFNGLQQWTDIHLATSTGGSVANDNSLDIKNPSNKVRSAFQSNQQFLVVSAPDSLGELSDGSSVNPTHVFNNTIGVAGWPFHINIGTSTGGNYSNIFISKFCNGSFVDRVKNIAGWTDPEYFVSEHKQEQHALSNWLVNYCKDVEKEYLTLGNKEFENIYTIINSPEWNGILALNVDIGLSDFPEQIKGLLAGIDQSLFKANHFGVEINRVEFDGTNLSSATNSSLFGLINYVDPGYKNGNVPAGPTNVDYDFKVLTLKVLFKNSGIASFNSELQLTLNTLFENEVVNPTSAPQFNTTLLKGSYENHDGQNTYMFVGKGKKLFNLASNVLTGVELEKVQFKTTSKDQTSNDVTTRFSMWGNLVYGHDLLPIDTFTFDALNYADLGINMDFNDLNPGARTFSFDPTAMTFDVSSSKPRYTGFAVNFPMTLNGLSIGTSGKSPKDLGYLPVQSPFSLDSNNSGISGDWYGLTFKLNMGTLGALASKADLNATILVAWSPGVDSSNKGYGAEVFIHLPGSGGSSSLFSLQGIIKLTIEDIQLFLTVDGHVSTYTMKFTDIALKLLSLTFPPGGTTGMYLFGDPMEHGEAHTGNNSSLGWYAAYQQNPPS